MLLCANTPQLHDVDLSSLLARDEGHCIDEARDSGSR